MPGVVGVEDADGGESDGFGGVEIEEFGLALLGFLVLRVYAVVYVFFSRC